MTFQNIRKFLITFSMLLFPITIWYFSPYIIIMAAMQHIINGSFIVFTLMFLLGIFFGRLWCGFLCPAGGMSECFEHFSPKTPKQGWRNYLKYGIWFVWLSGVIVCHILGKGNYTIQPFFKTEHGISISNIYCYTIYYGIIFLFLIPAIVHGKRASCHYICWMAPFMILGYKLGSALHLPQLKIKIQKDNCIECAKCNKICKMSVDVKSFVLSDKTNDIHTAECILCGECVLSCPKNVLSYKITNR